jgi:hypothetical protein
VRTPSTTGYLAAVALQLGPLCVPVEHHSALVNSPQQQQRCVVLYAVQARHVHLAAYGLFEAHGKLDRRVRLREVKRLALADQPSHITGRNRRVASSAPTARGRG